MFTTSIRPPQSCLRVRTSARRPRRQRRAKAAVERPSRCPRTRLPLSPTTTHPHDARDRKPGFRSPRFPITITRTPTPPFLDESAGRPRTSSLAHELH
jgi:hypothetical protein